MSEVRQKTNGETETMTLTTEELKAMLNAEYERGKKEGEKVEVVRYVYAPPLVTSPPWPQYPIVTYVNSGSVTL